MQVFEVVEPLTAFVFKRVADGDGSVDGTNYAELESDVMGVGGKVERVADDLVVISLDGTNYTLPLGFVVFPKMAGKVMSVAMFERGYIGVDGADGLSERVAKLETELANLMALGGRLTAVETALAGKGRRKASE